MADYTYYVNTDGGGHYSTLAAAEAGLQQDLVANGTNQLYIACSGTTDDTTAVTFDGWNTSTSHWINIVGNAYAAWWDWNYYTLCVSGGSNALRISEPNVRLYYLQVQLNNTSSTLQHGTIHYDGAGQGNFYRCKVHGGSGHTSTSKLRGILALGGGTSSDLYVMSCLVYGFNSASAACYAGDAGTLHWANCNAHMSTTGFKRTGGTHYTHNCMAVGCSDGFDGALNDLYCCSDIAGDISGTGARIGTPYFENYWAGDFRLKGTDTVARNYGNGAYVIWNGDMVGMPFGAEGQTDIGCFEYYPLDMILPRRNTVSSSSDGPFTFYQSHNIGVVEAKVNSSSDQFAFTQLHILVPIDSIVQPTSTMPGVDVSIQIEGMEEGSTVWPTSDSFPFGYDLVFHPETGYVHIRIDGIKLSQLHNLVVNGDTVATGSDQSAVNLIVNLTAVQDSTVNPTDDGIIFGPEHYNIVFPAQGSIVFSTTTRLYPYGGTQHISSRRTASRPDYRVVLNATELLLAENVTSQKFVGLAADQDF